MTIDQNNRKRAHATRGGVLPQLGRYHTSFLPRAEDERLVEIQMAADGNCLFRCFSDQLYGTPNHFTLLRQKCFQYIQVEKQWFEPYIAEPFSEYIVRKMQDGEWADDVEIQALGEIYDSAIEIYSHNGEMLRTFHENEGQSASLPGREAERITIRLVYRGESHYNSYRPVDWIPLIRHVRERYLFHEQLPSNAASLPGDVEDLAIQRRMKVSLPHPPTALGGVDEMAVCLRLSEEEARLREERDMHQLLTQTRDEADSEAELQEAIRMSLAVRRAGSPLGRNPKAPAISPQPLDDLPDAVLRLISLGGISLELARKAFNHVGDDIELMQIWLAEHS